MFDCSDNQIHTEYLKCIYTYMCTQACALKTLWKHLSSWGNGKTFWANALWHLLPNKSSAIFQEQVTVTSNVVSVRVRKFIKLRQYVQSQRMLAFRYTIDYQIHLIGTLNKSCIALSAELRSSHQTWSLSYLWLMENLYNTFWRCFMIFFIKSYFRVVLFVYT